MGVKKWASALLFIGCVAVLTAAALEFFWVQPEAELTRAMAKLEAKDYVAQRLALRVATAQALGSLTLLIGIFLTWRSLRLTQANLDIARSALKVNTDTQEANLSAAHHKQMTELLSKAVEQLGHVQLGVRIGGVFILEQVAQESPALEQPIVDILVAYLRHRSPWPRADAQMPMIEREDVQAVVSVLTRRTKAKRVPTLRVDLSQIDLCDTDMRAIQLQNVSMRGANLSRAKLNNAGLAEADLSEAILDSADLTGVSMTSAILTGASLKEAQCEGSDFTAASLVGSNLAHANLQKCNFTGAVLLDANIKDAHCWLANFSDAVLQPANATGADLRQAILMHTGLHHVNLEGARLSGTALHDLDLRGTDLSYADLARCDFSNANMTTSHLTGANLESATLTSADLRGAELELAVLTGADLRRTDLRGARGLNSAIVTRGQLLEAVLDVETKNQFSID